MATLWIEEEPDIPLAGRGTIPVHEASLGNGVQQQVAIGATTLSSSAFGANTKLITIHADAECYIDIGTTPTATTSTRHLLLGAYRTFRVKSGDKIAVKDTS